MKTSEMNEKQKKAYYNVLGAAKKIIGAYENAIMYFEPGPVHDLYVAALADHDAIVAEIYESAITQIHEKLLERFQSYCNVEEIRSCGKQFIMEQIELRLKKMGY